jgi:hypothetical protein
VIDRFVATRGLIERRAEVSPDFVAIVRTFVSGIVNIEMGLVRGSSPHPSGRSEARWWRLGILATFRRFDLLRPSLGH